MIDLHTHSILSDGVLIPTELVRRAQVNGYSAIAITDHADASNIDIILPGLVKVAEMLNKYWDIIIIPGVELTHLPLEAFAEMTEYARARGAKLVVAHGESPVEPVIPGTNAAAIAAGVDILAHPGNISDEDASLAAKKGVYLEITARAGHSEGNKRVLEAAVKAGANLVLNTDSHAPGDLFTPEKRDGILSSLGVREDAKEEIYSNSETIVDKFKA
ncbi:MAG: histidinol phosphate phosphatase domain-containing protein [Candidatus Tantalella remota]|nr:histidinol phosphate phosphatase domain-containing protein [Candidatus Tantalella remota]